MDERDTNIKVEGKIKTLKKLDNEYNILFVKSKSIDEKYKTSFGTFIIQGVGSFSENDNVTFIGEWKYNKKYDNWAFHFMDYERKKPEKDDEIIAYLQSHIFKGVGPVLAKRIVDKFKEETLNIIEHSPERLKEVKGMGKKKFDEIMSTYNESESYKQLTKLLVPPPINMGGATIARIYKELGKKACELIEENPYILCEKVSRIGFKQADLIAREKFEIEPNSITRIRAGILFILKDAALSSGHLYLPIRVLYENFRKILPEIGIKDFNEVIKLLNKHEIRVIVKEGDASNSPVALKRYMDIEENIAEKVMELSNRGRKIKKLESYIDEIQKDIGITYAPKQLEALLHIDKSNFFIITGGPGTGKSTIINGIIQVLEKDNPTTEILMMAPTGRASKRMEETTGKEATTIHRALEFKPSEGFTRNEENPLDADVIIIDEASMIDAYLMNCLLRAIRVRTKVIVVGDTDQLPSVGPGSVLSDMISSDKVPVVRLNQVFRQGKDSLIKVNSQYIREGNTRLEYSEGEFNLIEDTIPQDLQERIIQAYIDELFKEKERTDSITKAIYNVQILTPTKIGLVGTIALNNKIQEYINANTKNEVVSTYKDKDGEEITIHFRIGDKVMQTTNNYDKQVFNGDLGIITAIEKTEKEIEVQVEFEDGRVAEYNKEELKGELIHAYATTIHKSQGSEYSTVILVISSMHRFMNQRNLFYTGETRAKKKIHVCGDREAINRSITTIDANIRYTLLKSFLTK